MIESWFFFTAPSMHVNGPLVDLVAVRVRVGMCFCIVPISGEMFLFAISCQDD